MKNNENSETEESTNTYLIIVKFILVVACLCGTVIRITIAPDYVNFYMAVVNIASFLIAVNLFMYDCYSKLRAHSKEVHENILRKSKIENIAMMFYIAIFIINLILIFILCSVYLIKSFDMAILNDCLGIISLGFALTTDFLSNFIVGIISFFE